MLHYVAKHPGFWHWSDTGVGGGANNLAPGVTAADRLLLVHVLIVLFLSVQVLVLTQTYEAIGGSAYSLSPGLTAA